MKELEAEMMVVDDQYGLLDDKQAKEQITEFVEAE